VSLELATATETVTVTVTVTGTGTGTEIGVIEAGLGTMIEGGKETDHVHRDGSGTEIAARGVAQGPDAIALARVPEPGETTEMIDATEVGREDVSVLSSVNAVSVPKTGAVFVTGVVIETGAVIGTGAETDVTITPVRAHDA
jgi:hypothetical protein